MAGVVSTLVDNFLYNPVNWVLAAILLQVLKAAVYPEQVKLAPPKHPSIIELRKFTPKELARFDGVDGRPIYIASAGMVFDVTRSAGFYGPGGMYENFAGRDASRGLAKNSFDKSEIADINGPIDKLTNLNAEEKQSLLDWTQFYLGKYDHVGTLVENHDIK
eukprot:jgi/Hompol1/515/HPOL_002383-RA